MGFRLIILAVLGLGGLYMIHLLAQDFNKIRKPFGGGGPAAAAAAVKGIRSLFFSKRDLTSKSYKKYIEEVSSEEEELPSTTTASVNVDWENILKFDPFNCALSLICQVSADAEKDNKLAKDIIDLIRNNIGNDLTPKVVINAFNAGKKYRSNFKMCYNDYPLCVYSAKTMLKLIEFYSKFDN